MNMNEHLLRENPATRHPLALVHSTLYPRQQRSDARGCSHVSVSVHIAHMHYRPRTHHPSAQAPTRIMPRPMSPRHRSRLPDPAAIVGRAVSSSFHTNPDLLMACVSCRRQLTALLCLT